MIWGKAVKEKKNFEICITFSFLNCLIFNRLFLGWHFYGKKY